MADETAELRKRSGTEESDDGVVCLLYLLMRDHLPVGVVETLVRACSSESAFTNGYLERYAKDLRARILDGDVDPKPRRPDAEVAAPMAARILELETAMRDLGLRYSDGYVSFHPPPGYTATTWKGHPDAYKDAELTKAVIKRFLEVLERSTVPNPDAAVKDPP